MAEFLGIANFVGLPDGRQGVVRPERVRLGREGQGQPARVVEAIYLGQMVRYHLALESNQSVVVAVPFLGSAHAPGERVSVSWDSADVWPVT